MPDYDCGERELKNESLKAVLEDMTEVLAEKEGYIGEDGLLHCRKCYEPNEAFFPEGIELFGRDRRPAECRCRRKERERRECEEQEKRKKANV